MQGLRANEVVAAAFEDIFIVRSEKAFKDDPEKIGENLKTFLPTKFA